MTLDATRFSEFFREAHRDPETGTTFDPFPWQQRLADRVCSPGDDAAWPDALALPTGSGKTTCIDIALLALACQADLPTSERKAPRRILFVVDRRVIVDEAFQHALHLARRLHVATEGILFDVAEALRRVAGSDTPLTCHQLRGGMYRDDAWARTPSQPCVIASTVDQAGSRLLFRSYGRSFKSRPVHAGLAGNDTLLLLDEAHCANPFRQSMAAVQQYRRAPWAESAPASPFQFVILSATPPEDCGTILAAGDADRSHPVLGRRINAPKPTRLEVASRARGANAQGELAVALVEQALELAALHCEQQQAASPPATAILVNRVLTAKLVRELLAAIVHHLDPQCGQPSQNYDVRIIKRLAKQFTQRFENDANSFDYELMTGRMRPIDRQDVADAWLKKLNAGHADARGLQRPVFIVATQCLEVGANLDFDVMVSECASLDALRQRFGRLNRTGRDIPAPAAVIIRQDQVKPKEPDPVYGDALAATWHQLQRWLDDERAATSANKNADATSDPTEGDTPAQPTLDFSVQAMERRWQAQTADQRAALLPPAPDAPVMLPSHIDLWVQTAPEPQPTPDVSIFLHGPQRNAPEVQVCWRADLPRQDQRPAVSGLGRGQSDESRDAFAEGIIETVSLCPPTTMECLPVPMHAFLRWWQATGADASLTGELADVDSVTAETEAVATSKQRPLALVWRGPDDSRLLRHPRQLRPGDTIVLPAAAEGWDNLGYVPGADAQTIDVGDRCNWLVRRRAVLRLFGGDNSPRSEFDHIVGGSESARELRQTLAEFSTDPDALPDLDTVRDWLEEAADSLDQQELPVAWLKEVIKQGLDQSGRPELLVHPAESITGIVLRGRRRVSVTSDLLVASDQFTTEDDTASSGGQVPLRTHLNSVAQRAAAFAERCHLPPRIVNTLRLAGRWHDVGKADRRFQAFLFGGNQLAADLSGDLFAKSAGLRDDRRGSRTARRDAELPNGFRHELLSLQLAEHFCNSISDPGKSSAGNSGQDSIASDPDDIDHQLLLHLIAMHHGHCRPFAPVVLDECDDTQRLAIDLEPAGIAMSVSGADRRGWTPPHRIDSGVAERFWILVRRYGWWGLAWLEAIFVLADHRTSEAEEQKETLQRTEELTGVE